MNPLFYLFITALFLAALLAAIAIWAPRIPRVRAAALLVATLLIPVGYLQAVELLSRPKPMRYEWFKRNVELAQILGASFDEGRAIYLWLRIEQEIEPRYYILPWRQETAQKLEELIDNAIRKNATVLLKKPFFRKSLDDLGDLNAQIVPPKLPPQKSPPPPPQIFNPRSQGI
jgi:hypothetical protein